jgi:HSP20 family protein
MGALAPWGSFKRDIERMFDRMAADWDLPEFKPMGDWVPSLDFSETKDAYSAKLEIAGIEPRDIHVSVENGVLTVKGEKKQEKEEKDERRYRSERTYGSFARSIRLPGPVDTEKVTAAFKNGVLTVTMPKAPTAKGTQIPVKAE